MIMRLSPTAERLLDFGVVEVWPQLHHVDLGSVDQDGVGLARFGEQNPSGVCAAAGAGEFCRLRQRGDMRFGSLFLGYLGLDRGF